MSNKNLIKSIKKKVIKKIEYLYLILWECIFLNMLTRYLELMNTKKI